MFCAGIIELIWWPAVLDKFHQAARLCRSDRAIVTRTWEQQAADALPVPGRHPYQSQSVAFAVRAAEAFAPLNSSHSHAAEADAPLSASPHPDRTAVCCQVCPACMPAQCCNGHGTLLVIAVPNCISVHSLQGDVSTAIALRTVAVVILRQSQASSSVICA